MNARHVLLSSCLPLVLLAAGSPIGCADSDTEVGPLPQNDSGAPPPVADAAPAEDAAPDSAPLPDGGLACNEGGWCRTPLPGVPAPNLKAVYSVSPTRALATGETCVIQGSQYLCTTSILLWDGAAWSTLARGLERLTTIWASDADHFWIVNEQKRSLYRVTFNAQQQPELAIERLPYDLSTCSDAKLAIAGSSESNIYVSAYCYNGDTTTTGFLFHRAPGDGGSTPEWSTAWSAGGTADFQVGLGAVYVAPSGEAWVGGWKIHASQGTWGARYFIPDVMNTLVLHVANGTVEETELAPSLTMCPQSIWASSNGTIFVGGVCDSGYVDFTKYATLARRSSTGEWSSVYETPVGEWGAIGTSFPVLWGFADTEIYAVGSWAMAWNGSALATVSLAVNGAPVANRVVSVHGSAPNDVWMVGNGFAMHRAQ